MTSPSTLAATSKAALVRRPLLVGHLVANPAAVAGQALLERRLEVEDRLRRQVDLLDEGGDDRGRGLFEAMVEVAGADHRLADGRHRPLGGEQRRDVDSTVERSRAGART